MKILALDASTHSTGWAQFNDTELQNYGCITATSTDLIKRIYKMTDGIQEILDTNKNIEKIILEEVHPEQEIQNLKTHKALMYLQAAITFIIHDNYQKISIEYIYPSSWRKTCGIQTGRGIRRELLKLADKQFVKENYGIDVNDDIADAIGIGYSITHPFNNEINW